MRQREAQHRTSFASVHNANSHPERDGCLHWCSSGDSNSGSPALCAGFIFPLRSKNASRFGVRGFESSSMYNVNSHPERDGCFLGAPAGIRTPDTLLKRQVLCLLSYWGRRLPNSKPSAAGSSWKGRRKLRIWSFRGSYENRGSGMEQLSSDVAGMAGLEPTISESKSGVLPLHYIPLFL